MFLELLQRFSDLIYVQVGYNQAILLRARDGKEITLQSDRPFANSRLAIADFVIAEQFLKKAMSQLTGRSWFRIAPAVVMHQTVMNEGGLSPVEKRVLRDLGYQIRARQVYLWEGDMLTLAMLQQIDPHSLDKE